MFITWLRTRIFEFKPAERRAWALLRSNLTRNQLEQLLRRGYFEVTGGTTKRQYRIRIGRSLNIVEVDERGRPVRSLCFVPVGGLATGDVMLAQKTALECFESDALEVT